MSVIDQAVRQLQPVIAAELAKATASGIAPGRVVDQLADRLAPVIVNQTNQEPWYRSRVTWGAIGGVVLPLLGVLGVSTDLIRPDEFVALGVAAGAVASSLFTLYGRWVAKKPIGQ